LEPVQAVRTWMVDDAPTQSQMEFANEVLARRDPQDLKLGKDAAQSTISAAKAPWEVAESAFKRLVTLRKHGSISGRTDTGQALRACEDLG
jgi:hypothetical protein